MFCLLEQQTSLVDIPNLAEDYPHRQAVQQTTTTVVTVASSAAGQSDPPHLTQSLPAVAMVSVPRPIPLVQSNVAVALPESRAVASKVQVGWLSKLILCALLCIYPSLLMHDICIRVYCQLHAVLSFQPLSSCSIFLVCMSVCLTICLCVCLSFSETCTHLWHNYSSWQIDWKSV